MAKYLQMDGVDDFLRTSTITFNKMTIDYFMDSPQPQSRYALLDVRTGGTGIFDSAYTTGGTYFTDGKTYGGMSQFPIGVRRLLDVNLASLTTDNANVFSWNDGTKNTKGNIYSIKFFNGSNLVAHYDMSTGTVQDQSGNGNHATLTGGTWLDDGTGGTPTGTDGSVSVDTKQALYQDGTNPFDIRNILYQDGSTSSDTKQVVYQISSTSFDMLQEIFNDGQVGQTPFDMRFLLYSDGSVLHDSRQVTYESGINAFDLKQAIYESGEGKGDIHLVLFADSSTHYDLIQSLYENAAVNFDTKQISFNPDQQKIGTIRLQGKRDLYVYLVAKQELYVPLKAKRELTVSLKGGMNMTMQNQNFSMSAGDTKYLTFTIDGADDLTGVTINWTAKPRSYSSVENVLSKSTGDGITVENGEVKIKLDPDDTELLSGTYYHECLLEDNLQNVSTVFTGLMSVNK
ncbi:hypothetical protein AABM38_20395 [Heyndrickxia sp. MSNUG]|uniref:hypothetical protein n=1 Tax=Heyndrickxia sp. MSNUG TaxID=3136677 RepID=UPI003C2BD35F